MIKIRKKILFFVLASLLSPNSQEIKSLSRDAALLIPVAIVIPSLIGTSAAIIKSITNSSTYNDLEKQESLLLFNLFLHSICCSFLIIQLYKLTPTHKFIEKCLQIIKKVNETGLTKINAKNVGDETIIENIKQVYEDTEFPLINAYRDLKFIFIEIKNLKKLIVDANIDSGPPLAPKQKEFDTGSPLENKNKFVREIPSRIDTIFNDLKKQIPTICKLFYVLKNHPKLKKEMRELKEKKYHKKFRN